MDEHPATNWEAVGSNPTRSANLPCEDSAGRLSRKIPGSGSGLENRGT